MITRIIAWLIDRFKRKKKHVPNKGYGYHISDAMWERCKGVNPTGKYNDVC